MQLLEFEKPINELEREVEKLRAKAASQDDIDPKVKKILVETSKTQQSVSPIEQKMFKADEQSIEQLHKEIVQALQHLEQVEIDKD